jgi:dsRNA-specific ribonuclease
MQGHGGRRQYESRVSIDGEAQQSAIDFSIKASEQAAAEKTYKDLEAHGKIVQPTA